MHLKGGKQVVKGKRVGFRKIAHGEGDARLLTAEGLGSSAGPSGCSLLKAIAR